MTTVIIIGIIIFIIFAWVSKKKPTPPPPTPTYKKEQTTEELKAEMVQNILKNIKITVATSNSSSSYKEDSIIDVTGDNDRINPNSNLKKYSGGAPSWAH